MFIICLSDYILVKNVSDVTNERDMLVATKLIIVKNPTICKDNYLSVLSFILRMFFLQLY